MHLAAKGSCGTAMRTLFPILCTSGLAAEARVARAAGFQVIVGAGDRERTAMLVAAAARQAKCLISFGVAGGLSPHLRPGDAILSTEVIGDSGGDAAQRWCPDPHFSREMAALAPRIGAIAGPVLGASDVIKTEEDKRRAWRESGALAVDLESAIVARAATAAGIPFLVLRTIADPATRDLPPAALVPLAADGTPALRRVAAEVLRRPRQLAALWGLARETRRALTALAGPAHALRFAFADA
jgi:adenosylhomocysteine nucleosidase